MSSVGGKHTDSALLHIERVSKVYRGGVRANDSISLSVVGFIVTTLAVRRRR